MKINSNQILQLKAIKNSGYESVKVEFLFHSNKLEGSTFTKENLETYLSEQIIQGDHDVDDVYETINSTEVFDFVVETLQEPLTERLIKEFHQMLKKNTTDQKRGFAGSWKKIPNTILGTEGKLQVAQPHEVSELIAALIQSWDKSKKDFDSIVNFHIEFEKIHPFQDGNGRIGRFLILKQCIENNIDLISIDELYTKEYKEALFVAQTTNNTAPLQNVCHLCQQLTDEKPDFLKETLPYLDTLIL